MDAHDDSDARRARIDAAIADHRKLRVTHRRLPDGALDGPLVVHPLGVVVWGEVPTLGVWLESEQRLANLRLDRLESVELLDECWQPQPGRSLDELKRLSASEADERDRATDA